MTVLEPLVSRRHYRQHINHRHVYPQALLPTGSSYPQAVQLYQQAYPQAYFLVPAGKIPVLTFSDEFLRLITGNKVYVTGIFYADGYACG
jgi:hypothetical protein